MDNQKIIAECIDKLETLINYNGGYKQYTYQSLEDDRKSALIVNSEQHIKAQLKGIQDKLKTIQKN